MADKHASGTSADPTTLQPMLAGALGQHAALLHLLRAWDVNAPPHELQAQFTAIEATARNTETLLCKAIEAAEQSLSPASAPSWPSKRVPPTADSDHCPGSRKVVRPGPSAIDIECAVLDVASLTALGQWIEQARQIIEDVDSCRRDDSELSRLLREHDVRSALDWQREESYGLHLLYREIAESVAMLEAKPAEVPHG